MADSIAKSAQSLRAIEQKHAALVKRAQAFASSKSTLAIEANASLERVSCSFRATFALRCVTDTVTDRT